MNQYTEMAMAIIVFIILAATIRLFFSLSLLSLLFAIWFPVIVLYSNSDTIYFIRLPLSLHVITPLLSQCQIVSLLLCTILSALLK